MSDVISMIVSALLISWGANSTFGLSFSGVLVLTIGLMTWPWGWSVEEKG